MSGVTERVRGLLLAAGSGLLRAASCWVPGGIRSRWIEEWRYEMFRELGGLRSGRDLPRVVRHLAGAFRDARTLRRLEREETGGWLDRSRVELRGAATSLRAAPRFTLAAGAIFATGIAAGATLLGVLDTVLWRPLPLREAERLVQVEIHERGPESGDVHVGVRAPRSAVEIWNEKARGVTGVVGTWDSGFENILYLGGGERPERLRGAFVTAGFFDVLGATPLLGRPFGTADPVDSRAQSAVIGEALWRRQLGADPEVVGREIVLNGATFQIAAVMPSTVRHTRREPGPESIDPEVWLTIEALDRMPALGARERRMATVDAVFARLAPGVSAAAAGAELEALTAGTLHPDPAYRRWPVVMPLRQRLVRDARPALLPLAAAGLVLLLLVCLNVAGLQVVRWTERAGELAIRAALGAGRGRLIRQVALEVVLLAVLAGVLALPLASAALRGVGLAAPPTMPRMGELGLDGRSMAIVLGVTVLAGVLAMLAPAWQLRVNGALKNLREQGATARSTGRARRGLVIVQLALTTVLLTVAGLVAHSALNLTRVDHGIKTAGVVAIDVYRPYFVPPTDASERAYFAALTEAATSLPGVEAVALTTSVPFRPRDYFAPEWRLRRVSDGYFGLLGIQLLSGRGFESGDAPDTVVIDATLAQMRFGTTDAAGLRLEEGGDGPGALVIGVVEAVRHVRVDAPPLPVVYQSLRQVPDPRLTLLVRTAPGATVPVAVLVERLGQVDPDQPLQNVQTLEAALADSDAMRGREFYLRLIGAFALAAAITAAVGVYAVVSHNVASRRKEFGIRVALGAGRAGIALAVSRQAARMALVGGTAGWFASLAVGTYLETVFYGVTAVDPLTLACVSFLLAGLVFGACWGPARRALRDDTARILRLS